MNYLPHCALAGGTPFARLEWLIAVAVAAAAAAAAACRCWVSIIIPNN